MDLLPEVVRAACRPWTRWEAAARGTPCPRLHAVSNASRRRAPGTVLTDSRRATAPNGQAISIDVDPRACVKTLGHARGDPVARDRRGGVARDGAGGQGDRHRWRRQLEDRLPARARRAGQRSAHQAEEGALHGRRSELRRRRRGERRVRLPGRRLRQQHLRPGALHAQRRELDRRRPRARQRRSEVRHRFPGAAEPHRQPDRDADQHGRPLHHARPTSASGWRVRFPATSASRGRSRSRSSRCRRSRPASSTRTPTS